MRTQQAMALLVGLVFFSTCNVLATTFSATGDDHKEPENNNWYDQLDFEFLTDRIISVGLDGNPKMRLRVTNTGNEAINYIGFRFLPDQANENFPGCATFPNGGFVNLEPGESTIVSAWSNCYFGNGLQLPEGTSDHTANFIFSFDNEEITITEEFQIINDRDRTGPNSESGETMPIAGTITLDGGYTPMTNLIVKTLHSNEFQVELSPAGEGGFAFSFEADVRDDWYLVVKVNDQELEGVNFPHKTVKVSNYADTEDIQIDLASLDYQYSIDYDPVETVTTPTGFWRGAVSAQEETVVFIPGQENWADGNGKTADEWRAESTIFKYNFAGEELWSYKPGYECWGGDMTRDGSKVVYQLVPNGGTYGMGVLDGTSGQLLWKREYTMFGPEARALEGLEASFSNDGGLIAVGTVPTGVVTLVDAETGEFVKQYPNAPDGADNWGQIRSLKFDSQDEYLYVGSGDNYLRKVKVSDGTVLWKAFIGGWPFVNGFEFSSDESFIVTGTKSFDQARVNTATGETVWINDSGTLEVALSANDRYAMNFGGALMDTETGDYLAFLRQSAESHFFANDELVAKLDKDVAVSYLSGKRLTNSPQSGGALGGGEQSQWSYMSADGTLAIIAYRDMVTDPGNQVGIAFYRSTVTRDNLDPNNSPTGLALSASNLDENNTTGTLVGNLTTTDADENDSHTYALVEGEGDDDNDSFSIDNNTLHATDVLDYEAKAVYTVRIRTVDENGGSYAQAFEITVNDVNDAPESISLDDTAIDENSESGTSIGSLSTVDDDSNDSHTYSLIAGNGDTHNGSFTIEGDVLKASASFNHEETAALSILVRTEDAGGATHDETLTITVNDVNDAPTDMSLSNSSVLEGLDPGAEVGTLITTDEDAGETLSYQLAPGDGDDDNLDFDISDDMLVTASTFTFATRSDYSVRVKVTDSGGESFEKQFSITIDEAIVTSLEPDPQLINAIYPNPSADFVRVDLATESYPFDLKMYDLNGKLKAHTPEVFTNSVSLDVRELANGLYIIMVKDPSGGITRKKLIVER